MLGPFSIKFSARRSYFFCFIFPRFTVKFLLRIYGRFSPKIRLFLKKGLDKKCRRGIIIYKVKSFGKPAERQGRKVKRLTGFSV